jgi:hypothetical protein
MLRLLLLYLQSNISFLLNEFRSLCALELASANPHPQRERERESEPASISRKEDKVMKRQAEKGTGANVRAKKKTREETNVLSKHGYSIFFKGIFIVNLGTVGSSSA